MSSDEDELVVRKPTSTSVATAVRSSRRSRTSQKYEAQSSALEAIREAHKTGRIHRRDVSSLQKPVYEEVDEEEYNKIIRERQQNDFVVDDDGSGYADHGLDIFDEDDMLEHPGEPKRKKAKKEKQKKGKIGDFFTSSVSSKKDENTLTLCDDPDVEALLNEVEFENPLKENNFVGQRENLIDSKVVMRNPFKRSFSPTQIHPVTLNLLSLKKVKTSQKSVNAVAPDMTDAPRGSEIPEAQDSFDNGFILPEATSSGEKVEPHSTLSNTVEIREETEVRSNIADFPNDVANQSNSDSKVEFENNAPFALQWESSDVFDNIISEHVGQETTSSDFATVNAEGQNSLKMFWLDAFEDPFKFPGTVYIFGRLVNRTKSDTCCVIVKNIWRQVFFLPRDSQNDTVPSSKFDVAVYNEVQSLLKEHGITTTKCRVVEKKFASNDGIIPKVASVLEVQYVGSNVTLPSDLTGKYFSHVFNTTSTAMERLLLELDMRGPCWIEVLDYTESTPRVSYCAHEYVIDMERMKSVRVLDCKDSLPTIGVLGLNITSIVNDKKENEIILITCVYDGKCSLEKPATETSQLKRHCFLGKPSHGTIPFNLKAHLKQSKLDSCVKEASNERHLLSQFLCWLQNLDPDAYLGHDMSAQFSILLSRLEKLKIANWSCTSRLRRSVLLKSAGRSKAAQWEFTAGRFVLDSRSSAMELVRSRSYDLTELAECLLKCTREPTAGIQECFSSPPSLIKLINLSLYDAWLSLSIIARLNALPLFLQITQTVGGVLSRTLMGGRAERNEFLLLHAFYKNGYIIPNKYQRGKKGDDTDFSLLQHDDNHTTNTAEKPSKKAQYAGGLVLDPKKGLYDAYVLLLDFNSLYPSIIQEYNICFTTVDQSKKMISDADLPDLPVDSEEGILPREIRVLVERRREVKKLMNLDRISEQLRKQYDIRQMALKLTANSMYGCLGFIQSRFYAKPLAALITSRGREILMHTKDLVEKLGFSVIYGDTDSIMIDTGLVDLEQVKKLGYEIKKAVNKCHRKLELEVDGVYKKLLLLKKKKYVGLAVDLSTGEVKREMKGLDIVRRDWSILAKDIGNEIVDIILSDADRDEMVEKIHEALVSLSEKLASGVVEVSKFEISKQLTRGLNEYGDAKAQPHVAVAQRLNSTGKFQFHRGDTISYIICEDGSSNSAVQRAYHQMEVAENKGLKIDLHYYLAQQIHPVVSRLCEPIEGIDAVRIAEALGLDGSSYRNRLHVQGDEENQEGSSLTLQPDFTNCDSFVFQCPYDDCSESVNVRETFVGEDMNIRTWADSCSGCSRSLVPYSSYLANQLVMAMNSHVDQYYSPLYVCDDISCAFRSRRQGLKWSRDGVHCPKCSYGILRQQYSARMLFLQQCFYRSLFDLEKAIAKCKLEQQRKLKTRHNFSHLFKLHAHLLSVCDSFLDNNNFNRVSLSYLFANMTALQL